jgi:hypothetical protein
MAERDAAGGLERKLATILSADVAAYSRLMAEEKEPLLAGDSQRRKADP